MDPLHPSTPFLRRIARALTDVCDAQLRAWAEAVDGKFSAVSIVKTYRRNRLCGYEVWRHLAPAGEDPRRHKARLWFGRRHWRSELGYEGAALHMARQAARRLRAMSRRDLNRWWEQRLLARRATTTRRLPAEHLLEVRLDYTDLAQMSHRFERE